MSDDLRNLHIIIYSSFPRYSGGRENWIFNVLPYLLKKFNFVFLYVIKSNQPIYYDLSSYPRVRVKAVTTLFSLGFIYQLLNKLLFQSLFLFDVLFIYRKTIRSILKREIKSGDSILAMNSITELLPAIDVKKTIADIRLLSSVRGLVPEELGARIPLLRKWFQKLERDCLSECDDVLTNGYDTQTYLSNIGVESVVIPNGVDLDRFQIIHDDEEEELAVLQELKNSGLKIILMVATLRKIKGTEELLFATKRMKEKIGEKFLVVFVGKGDQNIYKQQAQNLGVQENVFFAGEQKNIPAYLKIADIVICISGGGGMSMSALEAMAVGKPIIAWNTPVYQQILTHMKDSYLVQYPDVNKLAEGIIFLLENPRIASELSAKAKQNANQYGWPMVASKLLEQL